jgi:hypothetical protein
VNGETSAEALGQGVTFAPLDANRLSTEAGMRNYSIGEMIRNDLRTPVGFLQKVPNLGKAVRARDSITFLNWARGIRSTVRIQGVLSEKHF